MIDEFVTSSEGAYVLTFVLAVAVGLVMSHRSVQAWVATALITVVFLVVAASRAGDLPFAAPLYVVTVAMTSVLVAAVQLRTSPLLAAEPWWRKVLLVLFHERAVREAGRDALSPVQPG